MSHPDTLPPGQGALVTWGTVLYVPYDPRPWPLITLAPL